MHDGVRQVARPSPLLVRWSGAGAFQVSWESLMSLACGVGPAGSKPTPAQLTDGQAEARAALDREVQSQREERRLLLATDALETSTRLFRCDETAR